MSQELKTAAEYAAEMKQELTTAKTELKAAKESYEQLAAKSVGAEQLKAAETKAADAETKVAELKTSLSAMQDQINSMKANVKTETPKTMRSAFEEVLGSEEFKNGAKGVIERKSGSFAMEIKLSTSDVTGDVARTQMEPGITGMGRFPNSILDIFQVRTLGANKNRIGYNEASYTDNTGYASEMAKIATANAATMQEKYRDVAKIGNFTPISTEMLEDFSGLVDWSVQEAQDAIRKKIDMLLKDGAGVDATKPKEIYGLKISGTTAFSAATSGVKADTPNTADVVLAAITQIKLQGKGKYRPTHVVISVSDLAELRLEKDVNKAYLMIPNVGEMIHGLIIIEDGDLAKGEMYVLSRETLYLYSKRDFQLVVDYVAETDQTNYYLWWRGNALVRNIDKLGNVYVSDITAAKTAITKS